MNQQTTETDKKANPKVSSISLLGMIGSLKDLALEDHYYCEDGWYSCSKAKNGYKFQGDRCSCGADKHNLKVQKLYQKIQKKIYRLIEK